jgi:hypothetical protein
MAYFSTTALCCIMDECAFPSTGYTHHRYNASILRLFRLPTRCHCLIKDGLLKELNVSWRNLENAETVKDIVRTDA